MESMKGVASVKFEVGKPRKQKDRSGILDRSIEE